MEEELKLLGLNDTDIKVYLALLELGESIASKIAELEGLVAHKSAADIRLKK